MGRVLEPDDLAREIERLGTTPETCLICGAPEPRKLFFRSEKWFWMCRACELVFVHDIYPEFIEEPPGGSARPAHQFAPAVPDRKSTSTLHTLEPYRETGQLLEVGCGQGRLLEIARDAGWEVHGVDVLPRAAELAQQRGLDIFLGELVDAGYADGQFDAVCMSEVIEHIVDPIELMRQVHRVLRPGGVALVGTDNVRSWAARLRGSGWHYYLFGRLGHIRYWGPKSARALAQVAGFRGVNVMTSGFAFREARELSGRWYAPLVKIAQNVVSPLAGPCRAGHRLRLLFTR